MRSKKAKDSTLVTWLVENLSEAENGMVQLTEIKKKIGESYNSQELGKTINKVFKGIIVKRRRDKRDWTKNTNVYIGLGWKECEEQSCTLQDIASIAPREFFTLDQCTTHITLGHFNGSTLNGNKLMTELTFHSSGMLEYVVCGKLLQPQNLTISDRFNFNENSVKSVFETAKKLRVCEGLDEDEIPSDSFYNKNKAVKELRSTNGSDVTPRIRSVKCEVVIPFLSLKVVCECCCKLIQVENVETDEEESCDTTVTLADQDHSDMQQVFEKVSNYFPEKVAVFFKSQTDAVGKPAKALRWDKRIIGLCLNLFSHSPRAYQDLRSSGFMFLPSQRLLHMYKKQMEQEPGINKQVNGVPSPGEPCSSSLMDASNSPSV